MDYFHRNRWQPFTETGGNLSPKFAMVLEDFKNTEYRKSYEIVKSNAEELRDAISL